MISNKGLINIERFYKANKAEQDIATMARQLGISERSLKRYLYELKKMGKIKTSEYDKFIKARIKELSDAEMIERLEGKGYQLIKQAVPSDARVKIPLSASGTEIKVGIVSDTHLGSKYQQLTHLNTAYDWFESKGIYQVLHAGDLTDGNGKVYKGHIYDMFLHGADDIVDYTCKYYPQRKDITTHVIGGNHDTSFISVEGLRILKLIADRRTDIKYHGDYYAHITIGPLTIALMHADGGVPYARSYRTQRVIEQIPGGDKPNVLIMGHLHVTDILPMYRNVLGILPGAFQSQTPYLARKGLNPDLCAFILRANLSGDRKDIHSVALDWLSFFVPVKNDY